MPFYEYACSACGHQFEQLQKMSDKPITICPECKAKKVQRLVSAAGFQLKGTGWYVTDFRDKTPAKPNADEQSVNKNEEKTESSSTSAATTEATKEAKKSPESSSDNKPKTDKSSSVKQDSKSSAQHVTKKSKNTEKSKN